MVQPPTARTESTYLVNRVDELETRLVKIEALQSLDAADIEALRSLAERLEKMETIMDRLCQMIPRLTHG